MPTAPLDAIHRNPDPAAAPATDAKTRLEELGLAPELVKYLLESGQAEAALEAAGGDLEEATSLRNQFATNTPQGRQAGGVYVAANPLEHVGNFMQFYAANRDRKAAKKTLEELQAEQAKRGGTYAGAVLENL